MNYYPYSDRKSRRTHKNSRDGCANCKIRRIKCTEELPECLNCVKKNLKCAYLDYTEKQLEPIRLKNEKRKRELDLIRQINDKVIVEGSSTQVLVQQTIPTTPSLRPSLKKKTSSNHINVQSMSQSSEIQQFSSHPDFHEASSPDIAGQYYSHLRYTSNSGTSLESQHSNIAFQKFRETPFSNSVRSQRLSDSDNVNLFSGLNQYVGNHSEYSDISGKINHQTSFEKMLPSSKFNPIRIELLKKKIGTSGLSFIPSQTPLSSFRSGSFDDILIRDYAHIIVGNMLEESCISELYFKYFMINTMDYIICIAYNAANENQFICNNKSPQVGFRGNHFDNQKLINTLESKSMKYYGGLISSLRSSVIGDSRECSVATSLFIAWNSLIHKDSSLDSLMIFVTGCSNLVYQSFSSGEYDKSPNLGYIFDIINETLCSVFFLRFRLNFKLLIEYELFLSRFIEIVDKFIQFSEDNTDYLKIKYNLMRLHEFVNKLNFHYIPSIINTNETTNEKCKSEANDNSISGELFYFNPRIAFEILQNWSNIIPPMTSKLNKNPIYKIFKLFYENIIRLLSSIFPYFKSVLVCDFTQSFKYFEEFSFKEFDFSSGSFQEFFHTHGENSFIGGFPLGEIKIITNYNLRMINFLNNRAKLLFLYNHLYENHKLLLTKLSKNEFLLKCINDIESNGSSISHTMKKGYNPNEIVVFSIDNNLEIVENQLTNFGNNSIKVEAYPLVTSINQTLSKKSEEKEEEEEGPTTFEHSLPVKDLEEKKYHIFHTEKDGNMLLNFDYDKGICKNDTDITDLIQNLCNITSGSNSQIINAEEKKRIIKVFYDTRIAIMKSIGR